MSYKVTKTIDEDVDQIIEEMSLDEKVRISRLSRDELAHLKHALRVYVQTRLEESISDEKLRESCIEAVEDELDEAGTSTEVIDALWERLAKTHRLRVV